MNLKRILLVEDDTEDQYLFIEALNAIKLSAFCKTVSNGQEALEHLNHSADYEVIFLDLNMPVMNGVDCLKRIKEHDKLKQIPVIVFTTTLNPYELEHCMELGAIKVFRKPNTFPELCNGLHSILMN